MHLIEISTFSLFLQTDRAAMLDEILDYVKFLRLQVKVNYACQFVSGQESLENFHNT